jgi:hypothetical protein
LNVETKPSDFFVGAIEFLGVVVPGAVLALLHGSAFLGVIGSSARDLNDRGLYWSVLAIASYVLGQLLLAIGEFIPDAVVNASDRYDADGWHGTLKKALPGPSCESRGDAFNRAFSYLQLENAGAAVAEIERRAGDFKLVRSLALLGIIDLAFASLNGTATPSRAFVDVVLAVMFFLRSMQLHSWRDRLAFEYATLYLNRVSGPKPQHDGPTPG